MTELFSMPEDDQEVLLRHLADWNPVKKVKVRDPQQVNESAVRCVGSSTCCS